MDTLKTLGRWTAACLVIAGFFGALSMTHNDEQHECGDERLVPSGKDRLLLITLNKDGTRMVEDHPKPVYGMAHSLPAR